MYNKKYDYASDSKAYIASNNNHSDCYHSISTKVVSK